MHKGTIINLNCIKQHHHEIPCNEPLDCNTLVFLHCDVISSTLITLCKTFTPVYTFKTRNYNNNTCI